MTAPGGPPPGGPRADEDRAPPEVPGALSSPKALPPEVVSEIRNALVEARVAAEQRAAYGPLRDLADAMRANAEALKSVQETQERIARTVDRADRSEAVIQSTQALNDTFRGVRATQEALVAKLETEQRRPLRYGIAAALLVAATAAAAAWWFVRREDGIRGRIEELKAGLGSADREAWERSRAEAEKDLLDRLEKLSRESTLSSADRATREKELLALHDDLEALRREKEAEVGRKAGLEAEVARLRQENAALRSDAEARRREAEEAARALREREAAVVIPPEVPAALPAPSREDPPLGSAAVTDPGQVKRALDGLNALLAGAPGPDRFRVTSAGALDGDRLVRVALEARGSGGGVRKSFEAAEARFVLLPASRSLEIRLRGGSVTYLGRRTVRFPDDRYTAFLEVDPAAFRAAANPLVAVE